MCGKCAACRKGMPEKGPSKQPERNRTGCFREKGRLALLLLHHRPLRVCSVVAPSHPTFLAKTADLGIFRQAQEGAAARMRRRIWGAKRWSSGFRVRSREGRAAA